MQEKTSTMQTEEQYLFDAFDKLPLRLKRHIIDIVNELRRAEALHPLWPKDTIHQAAIVGEEAGELIKATLQQQYEGGEFESIEEEAVQVGATVLRLLFNLKAGGK